MPSKKASSSSSVRRVSGVAPEAFQRAAASSIGGHFRLWATAPPLPHDSVLRAYVGRRAEAVELLDVMVQEATRRGEGTVVTLANSSLSVLHNGLSDYRAALLAALGVEARSRALTTTGPAAEDLYREAIDHLSSCRYATFLGRAHLLYGEWLRREGRRQDAREQLRAAYEMLSGMGVAFAGRAARELRATGEQPRKRAAQPADALTPQELRIARLVAAAATSREVAAQLFLSPRAIDAHLRNIFGKLGIASRRELRSVRLS
ncbi:LuxR C-terminal-related transcriptional regulator [Nonomuraea sp. NPDC050202]|uniref:LuxR C-terminal-related transcriptional regulator n=1 Tax=Nonomuraea sp. NPDC050202 TaxID=3155035 RepID=UPI0033E2C224